MRLRVFWIERLDRSARRTSAHSISYEVTIGLLVWASTLEEWWDFRTTQKVSSLRIAFLSVRRALKLTSLWK